MILPFSTAPEFVDSLLSDERFVPSTDLETQRGRGVRGHVFRGQCSRTWPPYPTAHRPGRPLLDFTPQAASNDASWVNTIPPATVKLFAALRLISHIHSELRAVLHFLEQADRLGIPTPIDYAALEKHQAILDVPSEAISNPHSDVPLDKAGEAVKGPFPDLEILPSIALAQHHGVPTRLLDWTESSLVAAYFGAAGCVAKLRSTGKPPEDAEVAVYIPHG